MMATMRRLRRWLFYFGIARSINRNRLTNVRFDFFIAACCKSIVYRSFKCWLTGQLFPFDSIHHTKQNQKRTLYSFFFFFFFFYNRGFDLSVEKYSFNLVFIALLYLFFVSSSLSCRRSNLRKFVDAQAQLIRSSASVTVIGIVDDLNVVSN